MSSRLGMEEKNKSVSMLCPCCGASIVRGTSLCNCGARFVGEPLNEMPIRVQRFGPAMISVAMLLLVITAALVATKWLALAAALVIWLAWRALQLTKRDPELYGGYKTVMVTLVVTVAGSVGLASYGIAHIPKALDNYRIRQVAATQAKMHHIASLLEQYKLILGTYPKDAREYKNATGETLPADYWDQNLSYQSYSAIADRSIELTGVQYNAFELRSAGPDGIAGTDDDIIMRDGIFFTNTEVKKEHVAQQLR